VISMLPNPMEVVTPLGDGHVRFTWEWGNDLWWGVIQAETGEVWWWKNHHVRFDYNISEGRFKTSPIYISPEMDEALTPHKKRYKRWQTET
jgi:hypothetical protein